MYITRNFFTKVSFCFVLEKSRMAYINFNQVNGEDFITILQNENEIKLDSSQFSQMMLHLHGLENMLAKKSKQNRPRKQVQFEKKMKKWASDNPKWTSGNPNFETVAAVFAEHLAQEIKSNYLSQCVDCLVDKDDCCDCMDKNKCIETYLQDAMYTLDNEYMRQILHNEYGIENYPSVDNLLLDTIFITVVKNKLSILL